MLQRRFREWTDPFFFKGKYNYRNATRELSEIINRNIDPDVLFAESTAVLKRILKVTHVHIIPQEDGKGPLLETDMRHLHAWHTGERIITSKACFPYCPVFDHATNALKATEDEKKGITELVVLTLLDNRVLGMVLLGEKLSGDAYNDEDYALLENFSAQFAVALEKAALYGQVKEHSKELSRKVTERTQELAEMRESERQMIVEIAHGLQTPLTVLKTEIGRLKQSLDGEANLNAFETSVDMVSKFIYDLLTLARLESIPQQIVRKKIDLSELIQEIVEYVDTTAESEHITVTHTITDSVFIEGDKIKLNEAMINLLSNAVKYMGNSKTRMIDVSLKTEKHKAVITVSDTGIGIASGDLPRMFSRFYRAKQSAMPQQSGTGLGLAITKMIIERHNGTIGVANNKEGGAKFTIRLPLAE
jgi:signal transduction histidine kinase